MDATEIGYRHFDTASLYGSEEPLGEAIVEAQKLGFIKSREELFITSKLWCNEAHPDLVIPAIKKSLRMGTAAYPFAPENTESAIINAIEIGYRHFDTASLYGSEEPLGKAIVEAQKLGFIKSREELFITSKLWCNEAYPDLVIPAIKKSLRNLKMDYLDLYLIHLPFSTIPESPPFPLYEEDIVAMDMQGVWKAMEECKRLGMAKAIGVSNFTVKKLEELLPVAKIPPQVNQVEMNPTWQQKKLRQYCNAKGIHVTAYSPLGGQEAPISTNMVTKSEVLKQIANARGKTVAQVSLRWVYEQGVSIIVKSFNKERMKTNIEIFDWNLSEEECRMISQIPQCKRYTMETIISNWKSHTDDEHFFVEEENRDNEF